MVVCFARRHEGMPPLYELEHAVKRNFSGLDEIDPWEIFKEKLMPVLLEQMDVDEQVSSIDLIKASFSDICPCFEARGGTINFNVKKHCANCRYLLIMTEEYSALPIIEEKFLKDRDDVNIIFGSSFPKDQEFAQICRDINKIKMCMETGRTVVLLNMESLYESLYDALNQYYVYFGGKQFVDLGLGTHRVKCKVHENFKLIVIADKKTVYRSFPIPLINRLEKHYVITSTSMTHEQHSIVNKLKDWTHDFSCILNKPSFHEADAFVGFNDDTCASIVIHLMECGYTDHDEIFEVGKQRLLNLATPDALARVYKSKLQEEAEQLWQIYFEEQNHSSLEAFLENFFGKAITEKYAYIQITTFSRLLSPDEVRSLHLGDVHVAAMSLALFQTEQSFRDSLKHYFKDQATQESLLIIQCSNSAETSNLIACAQHICREMKSKYWKKESPAYILFLLQLNHAHGSLNALSGSQSCWSCIHIDELREPSKSQPSFIHYVGKSISSMFDLPHLTDENQIFEVFEIVKGCIQSSMKELNFVKNMSTEEIAEKIKILFGFLDSHEECDVAFVKIIMQCVHQYLLEKEKMIEQDSIANWVQHEAVEQRHLPEYGTFREALKRCVEVRVTPILTRVLEEIDENNNLMIIKTNTQYKKLWIDIFEKIVTSIDKDMLRKSADESKQHFSCRYPFSSQIIQMMEKVIRTHVNAADLFKPVQTRNLIFGTVARKFTQLKDALHQVSLADGPSSKEHALPFLEISRERMGLARRLRGDNLVSAEEISQERIDEFNRNIKTPYMADLITELDQAMGLNDPVLLAYDVFNVSTTFTKTLGNFYGEPKSSTFDGNNNIALPLIQKENILEATIDHFFGEFNDAVRREQVKINAKIKELLKTGQLTSDLVENYKCEHPVSLDCVYADMFVDRAFYPDLMKLLKFALLITPSTANVERGFSVLTLLVTKHRNSLATKNIDHLMRLVLLGPDSLDDRTWEILVDKYKDI